MISKTYCVYPFISSSLQADNTVLPCGQFMKSTLFQNIIPINEVRHGSVMQEMRRKMLNGERVEGCQCYAEEDVGIPSMRQNGLNKYEFTTDTTIKKLELVMLATLTVTPNLICTYTSVTEKASIKLATTSPFKRLRLYSKQGMS